MPDLYLAWRGTADFSLDQMWGIRCSSSLPNFEQPQIGFAGQGILASVSGVSLLALSDRILCLCNVHDSGGIIFGLFSSSALCSAYCQSWPSWNTIGAQNGYLPESASLWPPGLAN